MNKLLLLLVSSLALLSSPATCIASTAPVIDLPSGVKITLTEPGRAGAPMPGPASVVKVHYRGTLENGKEFDSSHKRGSPATFPLNRVIPCWTESMQKISVGTKASIICPGPTAYGPSGIPGSIPPNATLRFDVELLEILR